MNSKSTTHRSPLLLAATAFLALAVGGGVVSKIDPLAQMAQMVQVGTPAAVHLTDGAPWTGSVPSTPLLVSAHNAGDTPQSARRAIGAGPSMIEVDVSWTGEQLVIAHDLPHGWTAQDFTTLDAGWSRTDGVSAVLIDVKSSSRDGLDQMVKFLETHRDRPIYLSTPDAAALSYLHSRAPWAKPLLSLTNQAQMDSMVSNGPPFAGLAGVSAKHSLLTESHVTAIRKHDLFILAYSVNDAARVNQLSTWGVGGITTDSLPVVRAFSPA